MITVTLTEEQLRWLCIGIGTLVGTIENFPSVLDGPLQGLLGRKDEIEQFGMELEGKLNEPK